MSFLSSLEKSTSLLLQVITSTSSQPNSLPGFFCKFQLSHLYMFFSLLISFATIFVLPPSALLRFIIKSFTAHWKHSNLFSPCTWPKREGKKSFYYVQGFFLSPAAVSFFCRRSYSILFHPIFSIVEPMSMRSLILIFKWMMKKGHCLLANWPALALLAVSAPISVQSLEM